MAGNETAPGPGAPALAQAPAAGEAVPRMRIATPIVLGLLVLALFFGGLGAWATLAPLESAAIATGVVSVDTNRKTVQHLEGGIIGEILVREGDRVAAGQVLIRLDQTQPKARLDLLHGQVVATETQLELLKEETAAVRTLLKKGLVQKPRLLALLRRKAELEGERGEALAQILAAEDVLKRSEILAPIEGTVVGLQVHTTGGVIKEGEPLMDIVPSQEGLVIEARLDPLDIDVVSAGLEAQVHLTPYNRRSSVPVAARVLSVSADSMVDERTGQSYYLARIELTQDPGEVVEGATLFPGMPVEVMILTGARTLADYLLRPVTRSFDRAFRED
ncbi:MAG: HlyD family efflux transporter periplasmic adaptor subunit [Alphaproteobacteria bacterium]|nr:HlyD family efflux transporter periplasmic adaptor subunit [Alphaproteobacteria bacterium]